MSVAILCADILCALLLVRLFIIVKSTAKFLIVANCIDKIWKISRSMKNNKLSNFFFVNNGFRHEYELLRFGELGLIICSWSSFDDLQEGFISFHSQRNSELDSIWFIALLATFLPRNFFYVLVSFGFLRQLVLFGMPFKKILNVSPRY